MVALNKSYKNFRRLLELRIAQSESTPPERFQQKDTDSREALLLAEATGIDERELLDRLIRSGFHSDNIEALHLLPIAVTAWASGSVTSEERKIARLAVFSTGLSENPEPTWLFLEWIRNRPSQSLWNLWRDYMDAKSQFPLTPRFRLQALTVYRAAKQVAYASGGLWGFGTISWAEQAVLDRMRTAYGLD